MKILKEWLVRAPWGNIALVSWGNPKGDPVLLVHGRQDSLDTFTPLLRFLPNKYYYVGIDLPGNGKSDAISPGVMLTRLSPVSAIHVVITNLKWNNFMYIGHSMGAELGLFYNAIYPGKITKLVQLDSKPALLRLQVTDLGHYFKSFYDQYYSNYNRFNVDTRVYSKEKALEAVMKARGFNKQQAQLILARNLKKIGDDKYRLSWDMRQKILAPSNFPAEFYAEIFSKNAPPTLFINARQSQGNYYIEGSAAVEKICSQLEKNKNVVNIEVEGGHDVHFTNPERIEGEISRFLEKDFGFKSKL